MQNRLTASSVIRYAAGMLSIGFLSGVAYSALLLWLGVRYWNRREPWARTALIWLNVVVGIYLLPLAAVFVDEFVLRTFWFSRTLPHWVGDVVRSAYPFMRFLGD